MKSSNLNLYIDESGSGYIGDKHFRFFLMAGVVMTEAEELKADSFMSVWRKKYLINSDSNFHTANFFEDLKDRKGRIIVHRKHKLENIEKFKEAVDELKNLLSYLTFKAHVYYVDLHNLRHELDLEKFMTDESIIKDILNKDYVGHTHYPVVTITKKLYSFHEKHIGKSKCGFVCYESQSENDIRIVESFHLHLNHCRSEQRYIFGKNILGINFYTKATLCAALEIADIIAYCNTQVLRKRDAQDELNSFNQERLAILFDFYKSIKKKFKIITESLTPDCRDQLRKIYDKQQIKAQYTKKASS